MLVGLMTSDVASRSATMSSSSSSSSSLSAPASIGGGVAAAAAAALAPSSSPSKTSSSSKAPSFSKLQTLLDVIEDNRNSKLGFGTSQTQIQSEQARSRNQAGGGNGATTSFPLTGSHLSMLPGAERRLIEGAHRNTSKAIMDSPALHALHHFNNNSTKGSLTGLKRNRTEIEGATQDNDNNQHNNKNYKNIIIKITKDETALNVTGAGAGGFGGVRSIHQETVAVAHTSEIRCKEEGGKDVKFGEKFAGSKLTCHMCKIKKTVTVSWMQCITGLIYKRNIKNCAKRFCARCIGKIAITYPGAVRITTTCPACLCLCLCDRCTKKKAALREKMLSQTKQLSQT